MFGLSWAELLVIAFVAVLVIGPRELPAVMHMLGRTVRRVQYLRYAMSAQFEDFLRQQDLQTLRSDIDYRPAAPTTPAEESEADEDPDYIPPAEDVAIEDAVIEDAAIEGDAAADAGDPLTAARERSDER